MDPAPPAPPGRPVQAGEAIPAPGRAAEALPLPAAQPSAATDFKIAVNDNGQRVDLRVMQRAGEIHVAVRTPDAVLATSLREELPALSAKLEQSGFHPEIWRPAATEDGSRKARDISAPDGAAREAAGEGRRQQDQPREGQQQDPRNAPSSANRKIDRKEFRWLFQSMR
jgi:hypothetical protein